MDAHAGSLYFLILITFLYDMHRHDCVSMLINVSLTAAMQITYPLTTAPPGLVFSSKVPMIEKIF